MQLVAWRTIGKNPCDAPPVHISFKVRRRPPLSQFWVPPWVMEEGAAIEIFGQEVVDLIGEHPVAVELSLTVK